METEQRIENEKKWRVNNEKRKNKVLRMNKE